MVWKIAKKEFLPNLMNFKLAVGRIVYIALVAAFIGKHNGDHIERHLLKKERIS